MNPVDILILTVIGIVVALIVRGMVRGSIRTCDTCGGNCASCGHACSTPRLKLTADQEAQLAEIDKMHGVRR